MKKKRVLLKISWEALAGHNDGGLDYEMLEEVVAMIQKVVAMNVEVGIVVGAGNFIRGAEMEKLSIDRCNGDNMGMLAININCIALADVLSQKWVQVRHVNSFGVDGVVERFNKPHVLKQLKKGKVILFWGGTGNPFFTTDTAGVLRALEIEADMMIKATKVDGVYTKDPMKHSDAVFIEEATYDEVITKNLRVMDGTAVALAKENNLMLKVVSLYETDAVLRAISGQKEGTTIVASNSSKK